MDVTAITSLDDLEGDRLAFRDDERPVIAAHPVLGGLSNLTCSQVIGLLSALGEYAVRAGHQADPWEAHGPHEWRRLDVAREHDDLTRFWWTRHDGWPTAEPADGAGDEIVALPDPGRQVFLPETSSHLALHKYIRGLETLTVRELCTLLDRLVRYSAIAQSMPMLGAWFEGPCRLVHGHNKLVSFASRPFTGAEFVESLMAVRKTYVDAPPESRSVDGSDLAGATPV